jgi:oxygen-independent coproporphyrinogen-3 oxidase
MSFVTGNNQSQLPQFTTLGDQHQPELEEYSTAIGWLDEVSKANGAYIHVPFCFHKCHYCDFFSVIGKKDQYQKFVERMVRELSLVGQKMHKVNTIYVGGGTPTLLPVELLEEMLDAICTYLPMDGETEFTVEANPETLTTEIASCLAANGVNRLSIGAQSFEMELLKQLERWHDPQNVQRAVEISRQAGIDNINIDLIYAIPTQTIEQVQEDLRIVIDLEPKHLSCYALTYEPNTPMRSKLDAGTISRVEHDIEVDMFDIVISKLNANGFLQYEISNFAKEGYACKHNVIYWKNKNWWPFGPAAAGHINGRRWRNSPRLSSYLSSESLPAVVDVELLSEDEQAGEAFMMGLRLLEGIEREVVEQLIEKSTEEWRRSVIKRNIEIGLLEWREDALVLTDKGLHFADTVISELLMRDDNEHGSST